MLKGGNWCSGLIRTKGCEFLQAWIKADGEVSQEVRIQWMPAQTCVHCNLYRWDDGENWGGL